MNNLLAAKHKGSGYLGMNRTSVAKRTQIHTMTNKCVYRTI